MTVRVLASSTAVAVAAAEMVQERARQAVAEHGRFVFGLTGGRSPRALYRLLAQSPLREGMPWALTHVIWGDERCVPAEDAENNAHLATTLLLAQVPVPAGQIHRVPVEMPAAAAAVSYEETLRRVVFPDGVARSDVLLLGLGDDGHVASLFPGSPALAERQRWVVDVARTEGPDRVSLTFAAINEAGLVILQVCGEAKGRVLRRVLDGEDLPARRVAPRDGQVLWLVDEAAAAVLPPDLGG